MISSMTRTAATWLPVAYPAASSSVSRHRLLPTFAGLGGEVCLQAVALTRPVPAAALRRDGDAVTGVRPDGLPGYPTAFVPAHLQAVDVPTITVPTTNVPTTTVRNEKHDPGPSVLRPPV